ncbi:MAG TPA: hypothetical protein VHS99_25040, partial [Chloroflexota bacterium]|nr:hypothetical protein [Chloroflexota bacterium]
MTADSARPAVAPLAPMLARQAWCEVLRMWRTPAFTVSGLLLPVLLYAFFGLPAAGRPLTGGEATAPAGA